MGGQRVAAVRAMAHCSLSVPIVTVLRTSTVLRPPGLILPVFISTTTALIRRVGVVKPWPRDAAQPRYRFPYLELDAFEYWTMGARIPETTVINRAVLEDKDARS